MKVLHISPWYEPAWSAGGTAVAVSTLCRELANIGIDVHVYTTLDSGKYGKLGINPNIQYLLGGVKVTYFDYGFPITSWKGAAFSKPLIKKLAKTIHEFDLIHISSTRHFLGLATMYYSSECSIPYIISPHASLMDQWMRLIGSRYKKHLYHKLIDRHVINNSSAVHFLCEGERVHSERQISGQRSFIVPNAIDINMEDINPNFIEKAKRRIKGSEKDRILIHVSRISPQKNVDIILDALKILMYREEYDFHLVLIGPAAENAYGRKLIHRITVDEELKEHVYLTGPLTRMQVLAWLSVADLFIMPSKVEGMSMALLEALALGLPVIVSNNVANYREIMMDQVGYVINDNPSELADILQVLINDQDLLDRLSKNTIKAVTTRYDPTNVAYMMSRAYKETLDKTFSKDLMWSR